MFRIRNVEKYSTRGLYVSTLHYLNPEIGIRLSVDPLAQQFPSLSPYNYTMGNPLRFIDPDGRAAWPPLGPIMVNLGLVKRTKVTANVSAVFGGYNIAGISTTTSLDPSNIITGTANQGIDVQFGLAKINGITSDNVEGAVSGLGIFEVDVWDDEAKITGDELKGELRLPISRSLPFITYGASYDHEGNQVDFLLGIGLVVGIEFRINLLKNDQEIDGNSEKEKKEKKEKLLEEEM